MEKIKLFVDEARIINEKLPVLNYQTEGKNKFVVKKNTRNTQRNFVSL